MARTLQFCLNGKPSRQLAELGAGDGTFMLRVARHLAVNSGVQRAGSDPPKATHTQASQDGNLIRPRSKILLLDKQRIISQETQKAFEMLGWQAEPIEADVFDWISQPTLEACDGIFANLFLHHFSEPQLRLLFSHIARLTSLFIAVEPRRSLWSVRFCRLLWLIGCNQVTRHDARISVRAGFEGDELSQLWPVEGIWSLMEEPANLASHLFIARGGGG